MKIYVYHAMRRSGNHALANWTIGNIIKSDDFELSRFNIPEIKYFHNSNFSDLKLLVSECNIVPKHGIFFGIEVGVVTKQEIEEFASFAASKGHEIYWMFGVRSFHNHFSSMGHKFGDRINTVSSFDNGWLKQIDYLEYQTSLPNLKFIPVLFDKWFTSREYRDDIARMCGFENTDIALNKVSTYAKGSSFDEMKYDGRAQEMKLLDRWKHVNWYHPHNMFVISKLAEASKKIFGELPPKIEKLSKVSRSIRDVKKTIKTLNDSLKLIKSKEAKEEVLTQLQNLIIIDKHFNSTPRDVFRDK